MIRTLREDIHQLQALEWRWERWERKELRYLKRRQSLTGHEVAPEGFFPFCDLQWVLRGERRSRSLRAADRHVLVTVERLGFRGACKVLGLGQKELRAHLNEIEATLYKGTSEEAHE